MITEDIIRQAQAGDSEAFAMIYNETIKTAYYVAKRILLDEDATEDVLQEAYIAVFNHLSDYKTGNLQGWIDTIVANRAKNYLRRKNPILFSICALIQTTFSKELSKLLECTFSIPDLSRI